MEFKSKPKRPIKLGTRRTIDMRTGEVVDEKPNAMTMLPCPADVCQECAVDHPFGDPHNWQSMYYKYQFYGKHGRWPTCVDAMAHCTPEVQRLWREKIIEVMVEKGIDVPDDLRNPPPKGGRR